MWTELSFLTALSPGHRKATRRPPHTPSFASETCLTRMTTFPTWTKISFKILIRKLPFPKSYNHILPKGSGQPPTTQTLTKKPLNSKSTFTISSGDKEKKITHRQRSAYMFIKEKERGLFICLLNFWLLALGRWWWWWWWWWCNKNWKRTLLVLWHAQPNFVICNNQW